MKICILYLNCRETGGAGVNTKLRNIKKQFEARGHQVLVVSGKFQSDDKEKGLYKAFYLQMYPFRSFTGHLTFSFFSFFKLLKIDKKEDFDLIYAIGNSGAFTLLMRRILKKPIVNHLVYPWKSRLYAVQDNRDIKSYVWFLPHIPLERLTLRKADKVITLTEGFKKDAVKYYGLDEEKIVVIPNGVEVPEGIEELYDIRKEYGISMDDIVYLFVGQITERKGVYELIDAFNMVNMEKKKLVLVGDFAKKMEHLKGIEDENIIFTDRISDRKILNSFYQCADIFVLPSRFEGMPNAVLEAMSYGLPIITTKIAGMIDLVNDGENGFLVPIQDPEELAGKMELITKQDYKRMGERSRERAERDFSWSSVAERTIKVFEEVINEYKR